jgi:hypothetical protein
VPARGALLFRARSPIDGQGTLIVQRELGRPEAMQKSLSVPAGLSDLRAPSGVAALTLEGERGALTVWLIVREGPTAPPLEMALQAVESGGSRELAVGRFDVRVQPDAQR